MRPRRGKACLLAAGALYLLVLAAWMASALVPDDPGIRWDRPVEGVDWIPPVPRG